MYALVCVFLCACKSEKMIEAAHGNAAWLDRCHRESASKWCVSRSAMHWVWSEGQTFMEIRRNVCERAAHFASKPFRLKVVWMKRSAARVHLTTTSKLLRANLAWSRSKTSKSFSVSVCKSADVCLAWSV